MTNQPLSGSPQSSVPAVQHQLPHDQLVDFLHREIERTGTSSIAVLILGLRIANRLEVLTGSISMPAIQRYTDQSLDNLLRASDRYANFSGEQICLVLPGIANKD
jgi:hypothetical protein